MHVGERGDGVLRRRGPILLLLLRARPPTPLDRLGGGVSRTCRVHARYAGQLVESFDVTPGPPATNKSGRIIHCVKFQNDLPGLDAVPWPGELGQRIYESASQEAWKLWEERMKMILNEYRLMPWQREAQELVAKHMEDFFFGEGAALPPERRAACWS